MATRAQPDRDLGFTAESAGDRITGLNDETKWAPLTTEFWAMVLVVVAILIATAVSDTLNDTRGWLLVTIVATGYIISRGLAKVGSGHVPGSAVTSRSRRR